MSKKYVATRKNICVGRLNWDFSSMYFQSDAARAVLFQINDDGLAEDLVYNSPNYQIKGIESKTDVESELYISQFMELEEILNHFKYDLDLTQEDINRIFKRFIDSSWIYYYMHAKDWFGHKNIIRQILSMEQKITPLDEQIEQLKLIACWQGKPHPKEPNYESIKRRTLI